MRRLTLGGVAMFPTTVIWRTQHPMQPQTFSKKISSWFSSWIQLGKHLNDSGREHTFPWVNVVNDLFCGPWPCGQSESVWNQAVMTGWGNQDTHGKNPEAQWWRTEWEISQIRKALHSSAHLFRLFATLSSSWETLAVTQHQRCHQQHDTVRSFYSSCNARLLYI